ncbi:MULTISPECIES: ATP-dependent DNA helicase RecG [Alteromonadaceae]|jgi:ATP-dependent DNA helicase RecG|uniref:ATP-dependent DNA helicase RecG n=1 Tax=Brumicola blandensis TaxID=3075611 RepID=A0AAW8QYQ5_9ALTE|nr:MULTISPECIES: ATP-dependent DNA helicase RecG [unclassified Alteromonas]MDT0582092.1 ATP-dependent DNA helicase RecG [Alteromonas sp. W409]MDT0627952.1 ATP-dependent DNA helicase RecG [Alteromonas sp. W364]
MKSLADTPVTTLKGVGAKVAEKLKKLNLVTLQDVIFHLPARYEDRTRIYPIADLHAYLHVSIQGEIMSADIQYGRRRMLLVKVSDGTASITLRFFHFSAAQTKSLAIGTTIRAFGEVRTGKSQLEMMHPEYKLIDENEDAALEDSLTPVYPTTEGVKQLTLRSLTEQALKQLDKGALVELLPKGLYENQVSLTEALHLVHRPPADVIIEDLDEGRHPAQKRLVIEELLAHHLSMLKVRSQSKADPGIAIPIDEALKQKFLSTLPFQPTGAQSRVVEEIEQNLQESQPMMRLVQGDVGSGKTLVAALSALSTISAGYQVALMAPTELLAEQHANNFSDWLTPLGIRVGWLAGKLKGKARTETLEKLATGDIDILVGTHAIFQEQVDYKNLALVIVDEQHRFGVHQRLALRKKGEVLGKYPHQLIMTATPIPRTLAMTAYADLDTSIIDELPPGRTPVTTVVLPDTRRGDVIERVRQAAIDNKRQTYWVCTLIDESEVLQCQAAEDAAIALRTALPELKVGLVHGRLKSAEKQAIMDEFKQGELDLLVATTVIEVGVDVPNASLMIIENPERLGLAQLHQLRGRVGRGSVESHCVLMYSSPLSKTASKRLGVLRESHDGFYIAEKDLEIRGPGELLGTKQTGIADLKIADLIRDAALIPDVKNMADYVWREYPSNSQALINRWLAYKEEYGNA